MTTSVPQLLLLIIIGFFLFGNTPKKVKQLIRSIKIIKKEFKKKKEDNSIGRVLVSKAKS